MKQRRNRPQPCHLTSNSRSLVHRGLTLSRFLSSSKPLIVLDSGDFCEKLYKLICDKCSGSYLTQCKCSVSAYYVYSLKICLQKPASPWVSIKYLSSHHLLLSSLSPEVPIGFYNVWHLVLSTLSWLFLPLPLILKWASTQTPSQVMGSAQLANLDKPAKEGTHQYLSFSPSP
jgi:hypothetical protein